MQKYKYIRRVVPRWLHPPLFISMWLSVDFATLKGLFMVLVLRIGHEIEPIQFSYKLIEKLF